MSIEGVPESSGAEFMIFSNYDDLANICNEVRKQHNSHRTRTNMEYSIQHVLNRHAEINPSDFERAKKEIVLGLQKQIGLKQAKTPDREYKDWLRDLENRQDEI